MEKILIFFVCAMLTAERHNCIIYLFIYLFFRHMTHTYKIIQYKNKPYSDNNEHHSSVALTDDQYEIERVKNYNETHKTILHYIQ